MSEYKQSDFEAAAKAAGYEIRQHPEVGSWLCIHPETSTNVPWEPHLNDADAFRLMVDAKICVDIREKSVNAYKDVEPATPSISLSNDSAKAVRKAIFATAVQIGKAM